MQSRVADRIFSARPTLEGAGVRLKRVFGFAEMPAFDPFLLLDDFGSNDPADYLAGFPWHPHRGIETITYMLQGRVEHGDSLGNSGVIGPGDVQWMTAGSGIIHQEMPRTGTAAADPSDSGLPAGAPGGGRSGAGDRASGLPAVVQPPGGRQDDGSPLPGSERRGHSRGEVGGRGDRPSGLRHGGRR